MNYEQSDIDRAVDIQKQISEMGSHVAVLNSEMGETRDEIISINKKIGELHKNDSGHVKVTNRLQWMYVILIVLVLTANPMINPTIASLLKAIVP